MSALVSDSGSRRKTKRGSNISSKRSSSKKRGRDSRPSSRRSPSSRRNSLTEKGKKKSSRASEKKSRTRGSSDGRKTRTWDSGSDMESDEVPVSKVEAVKVVTSRKKRIQPATYQPGENSTVYAGIIALMEVILICVAGFALSGFWRRVGDEKVHAFHEGMTLYGISTLVMALCALFVAASVYIRKRSTLWAAFGCNLFAVLLHLIVAAVYLWVEPKVTSTASYWMSEDIRHVDSGVATAMGFWQLVVGVFLYLGFLYPSSPANQRYVISGQPMGYKKVHGKSSRRRSHSDSSDDEGYSYDSSSDYLDDRHTDSEGEVVFRDTYFDAFGQAIGHIEHLP